jgi:hypothetical protein
MTRLLVDNIRRPGRGGERAGVDDEGTPRGRSGTSINDENSGVRLRGHRDDPAGRRSLTGLEFRRRRSA